jgi:16S rRNA (uracil1498-N3)-methyltransferase
MAGEGVDVFDGRGSRWDAEVVRVEKKGTDVRIRDAFEVPPPPAEIWLAAALVKAAPFEIILGKAVEIGVTRIIPFRAARSNLRERDRGPRWHRILVEAAKQSKRYHLPELERASTFDEMIGREARSRIFFAEGTETLLALGQKLEAPVLFAIGPEGGWTDEERVLASEAGFTIVGLGSHILKSETAAIVATGLIAHHLGVL